ncbi:8-oxo-dGTP pyrophosphatase MutT (NUDIX family) [Rhodovulum bhavnagarense]|uniref:8-oxo-dGTP pyrophosphatase MutT (NUDIX family) n=1 Tax=Rhodovulum bhavnagarense TaxID=992286 RepID=A0A4R2RCJ4_9RHOB|nr:CoA pyrophosphatase [Rhodovulum bhavnagarense]TCP61112.1 8-oxo-dGTP pyrophosphatase MutT (NUDIX family) [Rhodovulum bhavnagarense]
MPTDPVAPLRAALARAGRETSDYDLNPGFRLPEGRVLRDAAVLVPVRPTPRGLRLILTKRSSRLKHHPGQIAFPGGKVDEGDAGPVDAALREAREEIGLPPDLVEVLGTMPPHETVTGFTVTPVLGHVRDAFTPMPEAGEVDEVFDVPFAHVMTPAHFVVQSRIWRGQRRHYFTVPYGPYYIWGATARILRALADRVA